MFRQSLISLTLASAVVFVSCGKDSATKGHSANLPHVTPPVKAAIPAKFQTALSGSDVQGIADRFFNADGGPSNIYQLLKNIDGSIDSINNFTGKSEKACVTQAPVAYTIHPAGIEVPMFAQCYQILAAGAVSPVAGFNQYGVKDGVTYIYSNNAGNQFAAIVAPITGTTDKYTVKAWFTVPPSGAQWDSGSYGLMNLSANSDTKTFEFTAAGLGLGYCGAQLKSDATHIYASTSSDMNTSCSAQANVCVNAADITGATDCSDAVKAFDLTPIGRLSSTGMTSVHAASLYPATPNVMFDGTAADATHFGPLTFTTGVGSMD
ncbi:MAG: hypothetical protein H7249_00185 [Chitinophagaceae bacterium]|nr:hypothetical protein [Oligoflexus sp.]